MIINKSFSNGQYLSHFQLQVLKHFGTKDKESHLNGNVNIKHTIYSRTVLKFNRYELTKTIFVNNLQNNILNTDYTLKHTHNIELSRIHTCNQVYKTDADTRKKIEMEKNKQFYMFGLKHLLKYRIE